MRQWETSSDPKFVRFCYQTKKYRFPGSEKRLPYLKERFMTEIKLRWKSLSITKKNKKIEPEFPKSRLQYF